jgi:hypothetical protein
MPKKVFDAQSEILRKTVFILFNLKAPATCILHSYLIINVDFQLANAEPKQSSYLRLALDQAQLWIWSPPPDREGASLSRMTSAALGGPAWVCSSEHVRQSKSILECMAAAFSTGYSVSAQRPEEA